MGIEALFALGCYLFASLPFVWALARWKGINLREVGSGNVGGGNLWQTAGPAAGILGGVADLSKGMVPVLAGWLLGLELWAVLLGGAAAVAGQSWPLFLGFRGGRSNSVGLGLGLALVPLVFALAVLPVVLALLLYSLPHLRQRHLPWRQRFRFSRPQSRVVPVAMLLYFTLMPFLSLALVGERREVFLAWGGIWLLIVVRRLTAELGRDRQQSFRRDPEGRAGLLWHRFLFDRGKG